MKFRTVFCFEFAYQLRRPATWLYFGALLAVSFGLLRLSRLTDDTALNAPAHIAFFTVLGNVLWLLLAAGVSGDAAARDVQTRMQALTYTTPVSKRSYLAGRFVAALALNALLQLAVPVGMLLAFYAPGAATDLLGPFRVAAYASAYGFIALPTVFVATAIQFCLALLHRRSVVSYVGSVLLLVTSVFVSTTVANLTGRRELAQLLDAVGLINIVEEFERWTPAQKNTRLIGLHGALLWSRVFWGSVAWGALAVAYLRFEFGHHVARPSWWGRRLRRGKTSVPGPDGPQSSPKPAARAAVPQVRRTFGFSTRVRQTLAIAGAAFQTVARSRGGLPLVAAVALPAVVFAREYLQFMDVPLLPRTQEVLGFLTPALGNYQSPWVLLPLLLIFFAGELIWREREAGLRDIADATPVPEWSLLLGNFLGLGLIIGVWLGLLMTTGMLMQVSMGYTKVEAGVYLRALFGLQLPGYLLFALLALAVHALAGHKYVGHLVLLLAYGFLAFAPRIGVEHHVLLYAADPGWSYSDLRGFGPFLGPWLWFKLYWAAWGGLLAVIAVLFWRRGREDSFGVRLRLAHRRFTPATTGVAVAAAGLVLGLGGFIFYNTNVLNAYDTAADRQQRRAEYERRYGRYRHAPRPRHTATRLLVDLYPRQRRAAIHGTYRLLNRSARAIDTIHLATASVRLDEAAAVETGAVTFDRPATPVLLDDEHGHRIYALHQPLRPGDSLQLQFEVYYRPRGFRNSGAGAAVVANGSYFTNREWLPALGYQATRELSGAAVRRRHRLRARPLRPSVHELAARQDLTRHEQVAFEAVVSTDDNQTAVAQGLLRRTWAAGGRRYFHYATTRPILNDHAFFSAAYAVREAQWKNPAAGSRQVVAIQIFHHPGHTANLERMVRSLRAALAYYTRQFGPYPYPNLRVVERPGPGRGMHADGSAIDYEEGFSLLNPGAVPSGLDLPFYVVAHEVAHQWWGAAQLLAAPTEGSGLLVESLATFSAMQVLEHSLGPDQLAQYRNQVRKTYEVPRSPAAPPLLQATDAFHAYRKGPFALYALSKYIGQQPVNAALRRLLRKHGAGAPPLPTSLDLFRELQAVTPDSLRYLLHDLFEANTFWELKTEQATARQTPAGTWQVTLTVQARKKVVSTTGAEASVVLNDWVEIGVFAPAGKGPATEKPLYRQLHRMRSGLQTMTLTVPRRPARAGIDPQHLLMDLNPEDNTRQVSPAE